jgi:hypothetical protein
MKKCNSTTCPHGFNILECPYKWDALLGADNCSYQPGVIVSSNTAGLPEPEQKSERELLDEGWKILENSGLDTPFKGIPEQSEPAKEKTAKELYNEDPQAFSPEARKAILRVIAIEDYASNEKI